MENILYSLEDDKPKHRTESLEELLSQSKELTLIVSCDFKTDNITEKLADLKTKVNGRANIQLIVTHSSDYIYDQDQITKLQKVDNYCKDSNFKMIVNLGENATGELDNILIARDKIEDFAEKLNSITINENGKQVPLSPIEKYFVVYKFVANRVYNASENFGDDRMRNWVGVLSSDKVICSGFASLLKCVCDRVFKKDELACYKQGLDVYFKDTKDLAGGHANNLVIVHDEKYGVHGLFTSDACWGSKKERNSMEGSFEYCLNPISVYGKHKTYNFEFPENLFFYKDIDGVKTIKGRNCYNSDLLKTVVTQIGASDILCEKKYDLESKIHKKLFNDIQEKNRQIYETTQQEFNAFIRKNDLQQFFALEIPSSYPQTFLDNFPELMEYENMFRTLTLENLQENLPKLKEFEEFYTKHKTDVFDKLVEKAKDLGIYNNIFGILYDFALHSCVEEKSLPSFIPYDELKQVVDKEINDAYVKAKENGKEFLLPPPIPQEAIENGFKAVASYAGLTDETQIQNYVMHQIEKLNDLTSKAFEETSEK